MKSSLKPESGNLILDRGISYALEVIKLYRELAGDSVGRVLGGQLLRAGPSIGANVHEAQGGQSKADFIAKMSIVHKDSRECAYWLRLLSESLVVPQERLNHLLDDTDQIVRILSSILVSSKQGPRH